MHGAGNALPLTQRLVSRFVMIGLACVFSCLLVGLLLAHHGMMLELLPLTVLPSLLLLLLGGLALRRTVRLNAAIEAQLRHVANVANASESVLQPLSDREPTARGWNTLLNRISSRQAIARLEERLTASLGGVSERRMERVFSALPDGVAVTDADGRISLANNAMAAILSLPVDQIAGRTIDELLRELSGSQSEATLDKLRQHGGATAFELRSGPQLEDGVLRISRAPLADDEAKSTGHVWQVRDVTQQRLAEEMRNQFVFTATHELRTPLANIKAYAETLAIHQGIDVEQQKAFCNTINAEATRLARFVDELLNISQMEAGSLALGRQETDTERMLREVLEHVQPQMQQKKIAFEAKLPAKLPKLRIDKDKIAAALVNLLGNAAKYTPAEGRVRFAVEILPKELALHVEDSGIGIAPDELAKIFDKFFRSADPRVRDIPGNGLGLTFTQEVARLHGGKLTVHSELNKGSVFTMTLPL